MGLIMIVMEARGARDALCEQLRSAGFAVTGARDISDAGPLWQVMRPEAIVTDEAPTRAEREAIPAQVPLLLYSPSLRTSDSSILEGSRCFHDPTDRDRLFQVLRILCGRA